MGAITGELVGIVFVAVCAVAAIWWRIEGQIEKAKGEALSAMASAKADTANAVSAAHAQAQLAMTMLQEHKVHVAETYVSKTGLREMTAQVMHGQEDLKDAITHLTERIDRLVDQPQQGRGGLPSPP
jgi:translation initiation factor 2 alpha subunit (eIF-2alpha)